MVGDENKKIDFILVQNFPGECSLPRLRTKFEEVGKVVDLFLPKKLDKAGKPFGFVRFADYYDEDDILRALNNVWIESYKIRAFPPKYDRKNLVNKKQE